MADILSCSTMLGGTYEDIPCDCALLRESPYIVCHATKAVEKVNDTGWNANGVRLVRDPVEKKKK